MRIFISYRREDTQHAAGRLASELGTAFGAEAVFLDVRSIRPGAPFADVIREAGADADVLIALIGSRWLDAADASGQRRLDDERDFVRLEIAAAFEQGLRVVPTLVDGAAIPSAAALPEEISQLASRNAFELSHSRWESDVRRLVEALASERAQGVARLPIPPTKLVGRDAELDRLLTLLAREEVRLVTLTGPPGTGKTRLALEAARRALAELEVDACFVDLAPTRQPSLVLPEIATALEVRDTGEVPLLDRVVAALRGRRMLLVVDNFEQVRDAAPDVVALLEQLDDLKVLVTSRAALRVRGEHEEVLAPLPVGATDSPAVALFVDRAQAVDSRFALTDENADAVVAICAQLDGLPLALELAAARTKLLPPAAILSRLGHRLEFLTTGTRDLPQRQQTLRATLEWSYELLAVHERRLLTRFAVFAGGATLEAVEAICGPDLGADVLDALTTLVEDNLVQRADTRSGDMRFRMLQTLREFSSDELAASAEAHQLSRRHADFFAAFAQERAAEIRGARQVSALDRLEEEHDNVRAALEWTSEHELELAQELAASLWLFWSSRGHATEATWRLDRLLAATRGQRSEPRARLLVTAGWIASMTHGDNSIVQTAFDEAAAIAEELGADETLALALEGIGYVAYRAGDVAAAKTAWQRSLDAYRRIGDDWGTSYVLSAFVMVGDESMMDEALEIARGMGDKRREASILGNAGYSALARGEDERGRSLVEAAQAAQEGIGDFDSWLTGAVNLALAFLLTGDPQRTGPAFREALAAAADVDARVNVVYCLVGIAALAQLQGRPKRAATLLGSADALLPRGVRLEPVEQRVYDRTRAALEAELTNSELTDALAEGAAMRLEAAVAHGLDEVAASPTPVP